jgi:hypothetical protein
VPKKIDLIFRGSKKEDMIGKRKTTAEREPAQEKVKVSSESA